MSAVEEIRTKVQGRLSELEQEIESLREALRALDAQAQAAEAPAERPSPRRSAAGNGRAARTTRPAANGAARTRRSGTSRPPTQRSSAELERRLAETGGMSAVELARQTGTDYAQVLERIRELEQAGKKA